MELKVKSVINLITTKNLFYTNKNNTYTFTNSKKIIFYLL